MSERKARGARKSDRPAPDALKAKRDEFLHTFFKRGAQLTDEIVADNRKLRHRLEELEKDNTALKTQLASDRAIHDALRKIDQLEREKAKLLYVVEEKEEITGQITNRFAEVENQLENFAYLYVASFQLHLTLKVPEVLRQLKELLGQLVGAQSSAVYFHDVQARRLEPIVSDGIELDKVPVIPLREATPGGPVEAAVERAFLTGVAHVDLGDAPLAPAACVPLMMGESAAGVIVVYELLEQKPRFVTVDQELFKLLGAHAAGALLGAYHFGRSGQRIPTPAELRAITP